MNRQEMWAELRQRNVAKVIVDFSGGDQPIDVHKIMLLDAEGKEIGTLQRNGDWERVNPPNPDMLLVDLLIGPVYERYHSFQCDFYISGTVDYDVQNEKILLNNTDWCGRILLEEEIE